MVFWWSCARKEETREIEGTEDIIEIENTSQTVSLVLIPLSLFFINQGNGKRIHTFSSANIT